jgi:uncharacterized membrane protein (UPF0136 family)
MFGVGVFLGLFFGIRFVRSFKFMPGGVMTALRYQVPVQIVVNGSAYAIYKYGRELGLF